jgi:glycosyltransferase involved in cell wall biosynthesis
MKILLVSHYTLPHIGGIEVLVDQLSSSLVQRGHEVVVVSSQTGGAAREVRNGVQIERVPAWNPLERWLHIPFPMFSPALIPTLRRTMRDADVVHVHGVTYLGSLCALWWAWWQGKALVVTEHVGFVRYRRRLLNALQRLVLAATARVFSQRADAVIAYNSRVHTWLGRLTPYPERLHFVRNGIDVDAFRPASDAERRAARERFGIDRQRPLALFVGRFVEKKGLATLLQAVDGSFDVMLCGSGQLPANLAGSAAHVLSDIAHEEMPAVYHTADVFVMPSHGEGFPVAMMEAMASGVPVVAVHDHTYDVYATDLEIAQVAPEAASIRAEVARLVSDGAEGRRRRAAARARAVADFSLARSVSHHLAVYEEAVRRRRLSVALHRMGRDLATQLKVPVLRTLLGPSPPGPWADVGPGTGYVAHHVFGPGSVIAVDVDRGNLLALLTRARAAGDPPRFLPVCADLAALPFRTGALGTVLCSEVLEHLADDGTAAAELMRVLDPRGRLVVEVPHVGRGYASYLERLPIATVHDVPGPERHHRPGYTQATLAALFQPHGGRLTRQQTSVGVIGQLVIDLVALVHMAYERLWLKRSAWTWAEVETVADSPVFTVYRWLFPLLSAVTWVDRLFSRGGKGFVLGVRVERGDGAGSSTTTVNDPEPARASSRGPGRSE